ncbi:hypothetical protein FSP39_010963 [Pinctada imbricata]|uniref:Tyr recombinase domain-containing protein n=1 Tax=Pinctada imbricata TaxID=66713 RepID=A0AA88YBS8_PINIB|nr:hypothetical protein FSP39_010963 [Pinctada imbricata]
MLKDRMKTGASRPVSHKSIISDDDLHLINGYFQNAADAPIILRQYIWYAISIHFVTRGMEMHHQLRTDSFSFQKDGDHEYVTLHHEIQQKNYQGGANAAESPSDKRMYASTSGSLCPVTMLKLFLQKTPPDAEHLFNQFRRQAQEDPQGHSIWFSSKPLSKRSFGEFLPDICKAAGTSKRYTSHSLRATAIQCLNDAGMEARHIMYMSGHRNESSIRSYNRNVSSGQKRALSSTLSTLTSATETMQDLPDLRPSGTTNNSMAIVSRPQNSTASLDRIEVNETNSAPSVSTMASIVSNTMNVSSGFPSYFSNSTFSGCTFNFSK